MRETLRTDPPFVVEGRPEGRALHPRGAVKIAFRGFSIRRDHVRAERLAKWLELIEFVDLVEAESPYGGFPALLLGQLLRGVRNLLPGPALRRRDLVGLGLRRGSARREPVGWSHSGVGEELLVVEEHLGRVVDRQGVELRVNLARVDGGRHERARVEAGINRRQEAP